MVHKLAVDTGGTFTDFCLIKSNNDMYITKEPSTPEDPSQAILRGIERIIHTENIDPRDIHIFLHGTTVATNAILEQKGALTALITTEGFKDVLFIGRQNRPHLYDFRALKPKPLIPRNLVYELKERTLSDGSIERKPKKEEVDFVLEQLKRCGIESAAVCFLHSYANDFNEQYLNRLINKNLPGIYVTVSSEILPEFREYERTSTTVLNALVRPKIDRYLDNLSGSLQNYRINCSLYIMQSNGGVITTAKARKQSARTVLSGPAGGVQAGVYISKLTGYKNLLTADMGGTSMDICLISEGEARFTTEGEIEGYPLRLPMYDIHTVGTGGGSIAWLDAGGALKVGPKSAGSVPGPACYNLGGNEPTVTDANLVLGRLCPKDFAGEKQLKPELSKKCITEKIAAPLGMTLERAAEGIIRVVNANMARAMRVVSVQKGYDPRNFTLVSFGGASPLHAVQLARELEIPRILIPPYPGVTSAWGMLAADVKQDFSCIYIGKLGPADAGEVDGKFKRLCEKGKNALLSEGFKENEIRLRKFLDLRYKGQSYELTLELENSSLAGNESLMKRRFNELHKKRYGYYRDDANIEIVVLRLNAAAELSEIETKAEKTVNEVKCMENRKIFLAGKYMKVPVYLRSDIGAGWEAEGPAVISQNDTTTLVWPGDYIYCDKSGNLIIEVGK